MQYTQKRERVYVIIHMIFGHTIHLICILLFFLCFEFDVLVLGPIDLVLFSMSHHQFTRPTYLVISHEFFVSGCFWLDLKITELKNEHTHTHDNQKSNILVWSKIVVVMNLSVTRLSDITVSHKFDKTLNGFNCEIVCTSFL